MKRLVPVVVLGLVCSCALLNKAGVKAPTVNAPTVGGAGQDLLEIGKELKRCEELRAKVVTYEEEVQIGGAVALALGAKAGAVAIELSPELPAGPVKPAEWASKKPKPGAGDKTALTGHLDELGKGLASFSARPNIDWTFVVLENDGPNAFSAPGGYVFITTGMLKQLDNEAQLAAVLAHEIGHVTGRHALQEYRQQTVSACEWGIGLKKGSAFAADIVSAVNSDVNRFLGASVIDLNGATAEFIAKLTDGLVDALTSKGMGPRAEFEADQTAEQLMVFAGYDPSEYEKLIKKLPEGGRSTPHPSNGDRLEKLKEYREKELGPFATAGKAPPLADKVKVVTK